MTPPFPSLHTTANRDAENKAVHARETKERASALLDEIDALLSASVATGVRS